MITHIKVKGSICRFWHPGQKDVNARKGKRKYPQSLEAAELKAEIGGGGLWSQKWVSAG